MLPTNADEHYMLYLASTRDYIVRTNDFADAHQELAVKGMGEYYPCCGKRICRGCAHSFRQSGNMKCPFCNSDRGNKTGEETIEETTERAKANDAA